MPGRKTERKNFNTTQGVVEFSVTQLGGMSAGKLIMRLAKKLGPALGHIVSGKFNTANVSEAMGALDEAEFERTLLELMRGGQVNYGGEFHDATASVLDELFAGHVEELGKLLFFALQVNYENFLGALIAAGKPKP